jgi:short-chain Z-isoprenyl diphosphate synthase
LPESVVDAIGAAEAATAHYDSRLTIAAGYGGRDDIVDAVCSLLEAETD